MARSIQDIFNGIVAAKEAETALAGLTSPSQVSIWRAWAYITAVAVNALEQLQDVFKTEIDTLVSQSYFGTDAAMRFQLQQFQYSATDPQEFIIENFVPKYPVVDTALQIVTKISLKSEPDRRISIKVAQGQQPSITPLDPTQLAAFIGYVQAWQPAGTAIDVISILPDRVKVGIDVYYERGFVAATVKAAVIVAIDGYLQSNNFGGQIVLSKLSDAIQAVNGVADVVFSEVIARPENVPLANLSGITTLVSGYDVLNRRYEAAAGYIIAEDTVGNTLNDTITMILDS
jgi:hypothetical protein